MSIREIMFGIAMAVSLLMLTWMIRGCYVEIKCLETTCNHVDNGCVKACSLGNR